MSESAWSIAGSGAGATLVVLLIALFAHEPWRWLGLWLGRGVSATSEVFLWVRCVSTALVAALVGRVVFFPVGALEQISLPGRLAALALGVAVLFATGRNLALGVIAAGAALALSGVVFG